MRLRFVCARIGSARVARAVRRFPGPSRVPAGGVRRGGSEPCGVCAVSSVVVRSPRVVLSWVEISPSPCDRYLIRNTTTILAVTSRQFGYVAPSFRSQTRRVDLGSSRFSTAKESARARARSSLTRSRRSTSCAGARSCT